MNSDVKEVIHYVTEEGGVDFTPRPIRNPHMYVTAVLKIKRIEDEHGQYFRPSIRNLLVHMAGDKFERFRDETEAYEYGQGIQEALEDMARLDLTVLGL